MKRGSVGWGGIVG